MTLTNLLILVSCVISRIDTCVLIFIMSNVQYINVHTHVLGLEVSIPRARPRRKTRTLVSSRSDPLEDPVRDRTHDHV